MHTQSHLQHRLAGWLTHKGRADRSVQKNPRKTAPALMLLVSVSSLLMAGCSQQPSQEAVDQINARVEQLEQKVGKIEEQNKQVDEWMSNTQSSFITMDEKFAALTLQMEKVASRLSASPAVKPVQPQAAASQGKKQYHTVSRGETLYSIARRYGISVDEVRRLNNLGQNQPIQTGQKLVIAPGRQE